METKESSNKTQNSSREDALSKDCMQYIFLIILVLMVFESLLCCVFINSDCFQYIFTLLLSEGLSLLLAKPETINKSRKDLDLGVVFSKAIGAWLIPFTAFLYEWAAIKDFFEDVFSSILFHFSVGRWGTSSGLCREEPESASAGTFKLRWFWIFRKETKKKGWNSILCISQLKWCYVLSETSWQLVVACYTLQMSCWLLNSAS